MIRPGEYLVDSITPADDRRMGQHTPGHYENCDCIDCAAARIEALANQWKADRCAAAAHHWHHQYVGALAAADQATAALREAQP